MVFCVLNIDADDRLVQIEMLPKCNTCTGQIQAKHCVLPENTSMHFNSSLETLSFVILGEENILEHVGMRPT